MNNNEIGINLNIVKEYVNKTIRYLEDERNSEINKNKILICLLSTSKIVDNTKKILVNYLYYLQDKIDDVYKNEVDNSIYKMIISLKEDNCNE